MANGSGYLHFSLHSRNFFVSTTCLPRWTWPSLLHLVLPSSLLSTVSKLVWRTVAPSVSIHQGPQVSRTNTPHLAWRSLKRPRDWNAPHFQNPTKFDMINEHVELRTWSLRFRRRTLSFTLVKSRQKTQSPMATAFPVSFKSRWFSNLGVSRWINERDAALHWPYRSCD